MLIISSTPLADRGDADPAAVLSALEGSARTVLTPCGEGDMVWRIWGDGPPLLLVHGSRGSWNHWVRNIAALADRHTVIAPDLPGSGDSADLHVVDHANLVDTLALGLHHIAGPSLPIDAAGFSFGGIALAHFARAYPGFLRRLVLCDTGGLGTLQPDTTLRPVRREQGDARIVAHRHNLAKVMIHDPARIDALALHIQETNGEKARMKGRVFIVPKQLWDTLPLVRARIDAIFGAWDYPHPRPEVQEAALRAFAPDMEFRVVPDAGHWSMYEQPDAFNAALLDILARPV